MISEDHATRLKRLKMRMMRRGIKEMDLILMSFGDARLADMDTASLDRLEAFLDENDQDLYSWIAGHSTAPDEHQALVAEISNFLSER